MKLHPLAAIAYLVLATVFAGCNSNDYDEVQNEITELNAKVQELRGKRARAREKESELQQLIGEFERLQSKESSLLVELEEVKSYERDLNAALTHIATQLDRWEGATRRSLVGENLGLVRLPGERLLTNAHVVELGEETVKLQHESGVDTFELSEMPEPLRKKLLHEPTIVLEAELRN